MYRTNNVGSILGSKNVSLLWQGHLCYRANNVGSVLGSKNVSLLWQVIYVQDKTTLDQERCP